MNEIRESFLQVVAGDIEKLLIEDQENISFAYNKIQTGMKVSLGITFDPTADGIAVSYDLGYDLEPKPDPPEKHKVKYKHTINEGQAAFEYIGKEIREGRMSFMANGETIGNIKEAQP